MDYLIKASGDRIFPEGGGQQIRDADGEVIGAVGVTGLVVWGVTGGLYLANEGRALVILPEAEADSAMELMRSFSTGKDARVIGEVAIAPYYTTRDGWMTLINLTNTRPVPIVVKV